uniref:Ig-like domain-containing protein n=1 Tax=Varanus komodoensis TaxID=61221 RepID=A0A8D2IU88_VARKO
SPCLWLSRLRGAACLGWASTEVYPKPSISVSPGELLSRGENNITIECQAPKHAPGLTFLLFKSGDLRAVQKAKGDRSGANFTFSGLRLEDAANYTCKYSLNSPTLSEPSDPLELVVAGEFSLACQVPVLCFRD